LSAFAYLEGGEEFAATSSTPSFSSFYEPIALCFIATHLPKRNRAVFRHLGAKNIEFNSATNIWQQVYLAHNLSFDLKTKNNHLAFPNLI
jgi:hypothetical protein